MDYVNEDEFKNYFYNFKGDLRKLAEFIAYGVSKGNSDMSDFEGFGKEHNPMMKVLCYPSWDLEEIDKIEVNWGI
jgi:hypothetical protein